ncbi:MAG: A/G-specific adenine glycosylase [Akkermansia sp.]
MSLAALDREGVRKALLDWFVREGRVYPWRVTTDPWYILVSEIMLQQTTIPTVLGRYDAWMRQFPTPRDLANASEEEALRSWEGLGYYRRVRSLRAIAQAVVEQYGGVFPSDAKALMQLPGIGEYTCGAVLSFAFNIPAPIVDANVSRVIARLNNFCDSVDSTVGKKYMWAQAAEMVDPVNPRIFNSAIMELGQTYCKPQGADCLLCPVRAFCRAVDPDSLPVKNPKPEVTRKSHHDILYVTQGKILLARMEDGRHVGMYRFPVRSEAEVAGLPLLLKQSYSVTRYKMTRYLYGVSSPMELHDGEYFISIDDLDSLPMPSPDRKALGAPLVNRALKS